jgi:hypothetical protein
MNEFEVGARDFSLPLNGVTQPPINRHCGLRVGQWGHDEDHSFPSSDELKNGCSCTSHTPMCLHGMDMNCFTFVPLPSLVSVLPLFPN